MTARTAHSAHAVTSERARAQELGVQQRAGAEREGKQQPLDGVVALRKGSKGADVQGRDGEPGRARGALDEGDGERGGDGEEQAAEALVARTEAGGAFVEGVERALASWHGSRLLQAKGARGRAVAGRGGRDEHRVE